MREVSVSLLLIALLSVARADPSVLDRYAEPKVPAAPASEEDPFRWEAEVPTLAAGQEGKIVLRLVVPAGMHVYRDQLEVVVRDAAGFTVGAADFPPGRKMADPATGSDERELYDLDVLVHLPVTAPAASGLSKLAVEVRHQGCRPGLCFPPKTATLDLLARVTEE